MLLRYRVEEIDESSAWFAGVRSLDNPLQLFKEDLEDIARKLRPKNTIRTIFGWPFEERQINAILVKIERPKTLVSLALHKDTFELSLHIKGQNEIIQDSVKKVLDRVDSVQAGQEEQTRKALYSIPGAGKTVLASIVVERLENEFHNNQDIGVCYMYCSYKEHESHTIVGLIGNLLLQLIRRQDKVPDDIVTLHEEQRLTRAGPQLGELLTLLHGEIQRLDKVFCIVDALDECLEKSRYVFLEELVNCGAQLVITSRHLSVVEHDFKFSARLEVRANDEDVRKHVEARMISERQIARHVRGDPNLSTKIVETLVESAKGMFLLSQLHMGFLAKKSSKEDVREALDNLPATLDKTYEEAMLRELQYAFASVPGTTELDEEALPYEDDLVSVCAGLVDFDSESGVIRLVHCTAQKYFEFNGEKWFGQASVAIARSSLIYLSLAASDYDFSSIYTDKDNLASHRSDPYPESTALCQKFPFAFYAACNWGAHASGQPEMDLKDQIIDFFQKEANILMLIIVLWPGSGMTNLPKAFESTRSAFQYEVPGLFLGTCYNLPQIVSSYLTTGIGFGALYGSGTTPLHRAAFEGHEDLLKLLLDHGANPTAKSAAGLTAPFLATAGEHNAAVVALLIASVLPEFSVDSDTRLLLAASRGYEPTARLLLEVGANLETRNPNGMTPLIVAIDAFDSITPGRIDTVQMLLEKGPNIRAQDSLGNTALDYAVDCGHKDIMPLLIEYGIATGQGFPVPQDLTIQSYRTPKAPRSYR
ncbi:hypothetical protein MMC11_001718 [Xylographa trunciseda]|nr:hypothetical protein [Xylographa trunciseda]